MLVIKQVRDHLPLQALLSGMLAMADATVSFCVPAQSAREEERGAARVRTLGGSGALQDATAGATNWPQLMLSQVSFLRRLACRWHQGVADREDLVQDTLVRALASGHLWRPGSNLRAWLVTIMRNQFLASLAKSGRAQDADRAYIDAMSQMLSEACHSRLLLRDVSRSLSRMPNAQRQAVLLVGLEGKSYDEVASMMGISANAVRSHLARARQYLREAVHSGRSASPIGTRGGAVARLASAK